MTHEQVMMKSYEDFNRRSLAWVEEYCDSNVEWHMTDTLPDAESYHGRAGVRQFFEEQLWPVFERFELHPVGFEHHGEDRLLVRLDVKGSGAGSGMDLDAQLIHVVEFRGNKIASLRVFLGAEQEARARAAISA
ncbi:MAG: nuclear transport factor 2 family protein [Thermoleophilaceae bacterium]